MIECELLSGLRVRHLQKPRAGMVISGSVPNLARELCCSAGSAGLLIPKLEALFAAHGKLRVLFLADPDFAGWDLSVAWQDARWGFGTLPDSKALPFWLRLAGWTGASG